MPNFRHDVKFLCPACNRPVSVIFIEPARDIPVADVERYVGNAVISTMLAHTVWECPLRSKELLPT